jgi:hypothetical protein
MKERLGKDKWSRKNSREVIPKPRLEGSPAGRGAVAARTVGRGQEGMGDHRTANTE